MEKTYNDIVAENRALKRENRKLKMEYETQKASAYIWMDRYYKADQRVLDNKINVNLYIGDNSIQGNNTAGIRVLTALLIVKDKQINRLLDIIAK